MGDDTYKRQYEELMPQYSRLCKVVEDVLTRRIKEQQIKTSLITSRPKTYESFKSKIKRKPYKDPLGEITDLAGARVVCLYAPDLKRIENIIYKEFDVLEKVDKYEDLGSDRMGYLGVHFIVKLSKNYAGPHYEGLHGLRCEIQTRTILQDAWAIIDYHLIYKNEASMPEEIRRDINNVSSLLEIAQNIFDNVFLVKRASYITEVENAKGDKAIFLRQPVNYETLKIYTEWKYPGQPVSERWHPLLMRDLNLNKYKTLENIDEVVEKARLAVDAYKQEQPGYFKNSTAFITKSLGFVDEEFRKKHPFAEVTRQAFEKFKHLIKA